MTSYTISVAGRTLLGEARNQPESTQLAVVHVMVNRLRSGRWGGNLALVCRAPEQFSCWNSGDPNRVFMESLLDDDPALLRAIGLIGRVLGGELDPTHGAKWYKNTTLAWPRAWGVERPAVLVSGALSFYDLDAPSAIK